LNVEDVFRVCTLDGNFDYMDRAYYQSKMFSLAEDLKPDGAVTSCASESRALAVALNPTCHLTY
jgi:hypothetical protein